MQHSLPKASTTIIAMLLLACASASGQTGSPTDSRWAIRTPGRTNGDYFPSGVEKTQCAPLQYFLANPKNFEHDSDLTEPRRRASPGSVKESATSGRVGEIMGFTVYYVVFNIEYGEDYEFPSFIKLILVERKLGEYCEIFNDQGMLAEVNEVRPPYFLNVDSQTVLASRDPDSGNCGCYRDAFWTFDKNGPIFLDVWNVIDEAEKNAVPPGLGPWHGEGFDIQTLTYSYIYTSNNPNQSPGKLQLTFALSDHKLVPVSHNFESGVGY